ncbi:uncharacterized protein L969DRAFT_93405 [Mixia osmundae IAM 14324]|uniref:F-box domain-containing protein n=1 Tax=Mixia osmundae (strain CBS 9802 / IAM 14324 / JCM 22182 / KY 12970) TaxID=764103 RepID=G7EAQ4_MIXOS|nr:uncharacterized protein L969DRAFT_93405 [Mixia osmundae IAM 14324]KEI40883.1 hypothetical protein L969DRAFT_93405 [Mixia osmundae IAM 14324]GAA99914.1 hypothetical protein E5Q_06617 [Mixia osmundae IAM 14324]
MSASAGLFDRLPNELKSQIFVELPKHDLRQVSLTCKSLRACAAEDVFQKVALRDTASLDAFLRDVRMSSSFRDGITGLEIDFWTDRCTHWGQACVELIHMLPHLKSLHFGKDVWEAVCRASNQVPACAPGLTSLAFFNIGGIDGRSSQLISLAAKWIRACPCLLQLDISGYKGFDDFVGAAFDQLADVACAIAQHGSLEKLKMLPVTGESFHEESTMTSWTSGWTCALTEITLTMETTMAVIRSLLLPHHSSLQRLTLASIWEGDDEESPSGTADKTCLPALKRLAIQRERGAEQIFAVYTMPNLETLAMSEEAVDCLDLFSEHEQAVPTRSLKLLELYLTFDTLDRERGFNGRLLLELCEARKLPLVCLTLDGEERDAAWTYACCI